MKKQETNNSLLNSLPFQGKEAARGFTLVELIVVITILAILGTIAFISLQGYSKDARDSVRISDISKIKTSLELFQLDAGKYPETTEPTNITYSGAIAWTQGTFGETTFNNVTKLDKIPTDPVTDRKYVYSVTNTKQEYQIAGIMEGDEVTGLFNQTNAAGKTAMVKISGNYNGKLLKVSTGTTDYVLAVPSIITSSGTTVDEIISSKFLAYNGYKNLPAQYAGSSYEVLGDDEINLVNSDDLVIYSGDLKTLSSTELAGKTARKNLIEKLKSAYSGTAIIGIGEIAQIINTDTEDSSATEFLGATIVSNNLGGSITASIPRVNACATQPEYTGATYEIGVATEPDQAWQSSNASAPCYWTCGVGKVLDENTCVSETCSGTTPDGTAKVSNATSFAGGTWAYNTTPGKCTYSCGTLYHTEDNNTCISDTKSCTITHGTGEQTWNGTSRGACIATSCTDGYTGTNCEIAPIVQWKDIPGTNCTNDDITIGGKIWAGCNSILGTTGISTNADVYNGTCYDYAGNTTPTNCDASHMTYTAKEDLYNSTNGENNIWGKLYLWSNLTTACKNPIGGNFSNTTASTANCPCPTGRHVPSEQEFLNMEIALACTDSSVDLNRRCDGLGWKSTAGSYKTINPNSIVKKLKLPLAGTRNSGTFYLRGAIRSCGLLLSMILLVLVVGTGVGMVPQCFAVAGISLLSGSLLGVLRINLTIVRKIRLFALFVSFREANLLKIES